MSHSQPTKEALHAEVDHNLSYYKPDTIVGDTMSDVRERYKALSHTIIDICPVCDDLVDSLKCLELSQRAAIASLAKPQEG
jgi:hypothetical protein